MIWRRNGNRGLYCSPWWSSSNCLVVLGSSWPFEINPKGLDNSRRGKNLFWICHFSRRFRLSKWMRWKQLFCEDQRIVSQCINLSQRSEEWFQKGFGSSSTDNRVFEPKIKIRIFCPLYFQNSGHLRNSLKWDGILLSFQSQFFRLITTLSLKKIPDPNLSFEFIHQTLIINWAIGCLRGENMHITCYLFENSF